MGVQALQDIDQVGEWVDPVQHTGRDQALGDTGVLRPDFRPAEHPVLPADGNGPDLPFQMVGVQRNRRVFKEHLQRLFAIQGVGRRLSKWVRRQQRLLGLQLPQPREQVLHEGLAMHGPSGEMLVRSKGPQLLFCLVQGCNPVQGLDRELPVAGQGLLEPTPGMDPAGGMAHSLVPGRVLVVGIVTVGHQGARESGQQVVDHGVGAAGREVERHLVLVAVKWPEIGRGHPAFARRLVLLATRLDRSLVHGQDVA